MVRIAVHLCLIAALLGLHLPKMCPCAASETVDEKGERHACCPCCVGEEHEGGDSTDAAPTAPKPTNPKPSCPCLCCSPGYVPCTSEVSMPNQEQPTAERMFCFDQSSCSEGHLQKVIRPPRPAV